MLQVGVEGHDERWTAVDESHARVGTAVDSAFVPLWFSEESLEVEIVAREGGVVVSDEEALFERAHHLGHLDANRVIVGFECGGECLEPSFAVLTRVGIGVERGVDLAQDFHVTFDLIERITDERDAAVYATGEGEERPFTRAPFFPPSAAVALSMEPRTSPSPFAMRTPGGLSGPPWSLFRMPRTAAQ